MAQTDLHIHSSVSADGEISPRGLAELCCQEGITLAALTDHNDVSGAAEFIWRSAQLGVHAVPGVEVDCLQDGHRVHLLGYGMDIANASLLHGLQETSQALTDAGLRMMDAVAALGIRFDREQVLAQAGGHAVRAEMIARSALAVPENGTHPLMKVLWPGGALADRPVEGFRWTICEPGKPGHAAAELMQAEEAAALIHGASGLVVLTHPGVGAVEPEVMDRVLDLPLDGIEAFSSCHTAEHSAFCREKAQEKQLLLTGGSDFHGKSKPGIRLGAIDWQEQETQVRSGFLEALQQCCGK